MSATYCPCGETLHTKHCLAALFKCQPRAVRRMAALGRWPSTRIPVGAGGAGEYRFTDAMIAEIIAQGERRPANEPAEQPKQAKAAPQPQQRHRRTPAPVAPSGNVRPLVAKQPRRSA